MKLRFLKIVFLLMLLLAPRTDVYAAIDLGACDVGLKTGSINYASKLLRYCTTDGMVTMRIGTSIRGCSTAGQWQWADEFDTLVWCDGTDLWAMTDKDSPNDGNGDGSECRAVDPLVLGKVGTIQFNTDDGRYYICDSKGWARVE